MASELPADESGDADAVGRRSTFRSVLRTVRRYLRPVLIGLAFVIVWVALVLPDRLDQLTPLAFVRVPVEGLVLVAIGLVLPPRIRRIFAGVVGFLLGVLVLLKVLDMGYYDQLDRPFNPIIDWSSIGPAIGVLRDSVGSLSADLIVIAAIVLSVVVLIATTGAAVRVTTVSAGRRRIAVPVIGGLTCLWVLGATTGVQLRPHTPLAARAASNLAAVEARDVHTAVQDQHRFESQLVSGDSRRSTPTSNLLTSLRGKDVIIAFVESYGQIAVQNTSFSTGVDAVLRSGTKSLATAGYQSQSAWMNSPTFGGISWLAHSTLQSGLWIDNQQRYNQLITSNRWTLSDAFKQAGWRTVSDVPSDAGPWPQGTSFYHYDTLYNQKNTGYAGPKFSYAAIPDQYTLNAFQQGELQPGHAPVMAEIDLVSSHTPWTPLPHMVGWDQLGDGSIFDPMPAQGPTPGQLWQNADDVKASYGQSIQYSITSLISWLTTFRDPNLVLLMLGDHQPATIVSGPNATHEVPVSIISDDPTVFDHIAAWNWQDGLLPDAQAPVWPMDSFRNHFLDAFDAPPAAKAAGTRH
ncbi:MAG: sulfatase [Actinobacteria bacterium]|nr:sulfatase [Actinomycetota bacterium]